MIGFRGMKIKSSIISKAASQATLLQAAGRGARYLMGENLEVFWVEFSTLSYAVLLNHHKSAACKWPLLQLKTQPRMSPISWSFVHNRSLYRTMRRSSLRIEQIFKENKNYLVSAQRTLKWLESSSSFFKSDLKASRLKSYRRGGSPSVAHCWQYPIKN